LSNGANTLIGGQSLNFSTRAAQEGDVEFLFELKKQAEFGAINAIFGWNEQLQRNMHQDEWAEERPTIIEASGDAVGSFLLQKKEEHFYFCRFFLLPAYQGRGIGSEILSHCLKIADSEGRAIKLCYLQGNRVGGLYRTFGFKVTSEDAQFVFMQRAARNGLC